MNAFNNRVTRISAQSLLDVLKGLLFVGRNVGASVGVAIVSLLVFALMSRRVLRTNS